MNASAATASSSTSPALPVWSGGFVAEQLDVSIHSDPASAVAVQDLVGLALRRNPKRAHLLVSQVLAKHVPTEPALVMAAGELLGACVARELSLLMPDAGTLPPLSPAAPDTAATDVAATDTAAPDIAATDTAGPDFAAAAAQLTTVLQSPAGARQAALAVLAAQVAGLRTVVPNAVVIGYAETATGLGRLVANALGAYYIHSTRHATPGVQPVAGFEEGHSHATSHAMVPTDPHWLDGDGPVVLVDDELSTGSTVINTIRELHALVPHSTYVVAALIDLRSAADRARFDALGAELGARIAVTALGTGWIGLGDDILDRAGTLIQGLPDAAADPSAAPSPAGQAPAGRLALLDLAAGEVTPVRSDRFGNAAPPAPADIAAIAGHVAGLLAERDCRGPVVVVGCEENMFLPLAAAHALAALLPTVDVRFSTTTRSPIVPVDRADYAIAGALSFASHDLTNDGPGIRFAYNLTGAGRRPGTIVVFPEPGTNRSDVAPDTAGPQDSRSLQGGTADGLVPLAVAMTAAADDVVVVLLPADNPSMNTPSKVAP